MERSQTRPKLILPPLGAFYRWIEPLSYALMRFTVGAMILPHGMAKVHDGFGKLVQSMAHFGMQPAWLVAALVMTTETVGGFLVAVGFLTRLGAAMVAIDLAVITFHVKAGGGLGSMEDTLIWGVMAFVVALRGSGKVSIDYLIGWEL